ncbi:MAG TPA: phosphoribosylaminoimidazolesuccinocarboxamide synthase [Gemmatimonadota bacterium]|nr:phosphoribosylaminoimidazolesuccinocarboxamide synthase [Gemmatimonadota bacterium]
MTIGSADAITSIDLPLPRLHRGKVREMFALGDDILMLATDRLSAFDIVFDEGIPDKGRVLTGLSDFWFRRLEAAVPHHDLSIDVDDIVAAEPALEEHREALDGRAMRCRAAEPLLVECVVRGYVEGSGWREYQESGAVTGIPLPAGLQRGDRLPEPIFTPATKAATGHDENIPFDRMVEIVGGTLAETLRDRSIALYRESAGHAADRGLILADTKFEFGLAAAAGDGERPVLLIDEVLTPDSSRFWDADLWRPGGPQPSFDKQPVRDFLEAEKAAGRWDGEPPLPPLSAQAVEATRERYLEAYRRLTGGPLPRSRGAE